MIEDKFVSLEKNGEAAVLFRGVVNDITLGAGVEGDRTHIAFTLEDDEGETLTCMFRRVNIIEAAANSIVALLIKSMTDIYDVEVSGPGDQNGDFTLVNTIKFLDSV